MPNDTTEDERTVTFTEAEINRLLLHWYNRHPPSNLKAGKIEIAYVVRCTIDRHEQEAEEREYNKERDNYDAYIDQRMGWDR